MEVTERICQVFHVVTFVAKERSKNLVEMFTLDGCKISPSFLLYIFAKQTYTDAKKNRYRLIWNCASTVSFIKDGKQTMLSITIHVVTAVLTWLKYSDIASRLFN